ncbi:Rab GTPase-activating protein 1 [Trichinella pseudospiralis]|uniref:Rab GTPase-activating protein 1 n=1 Tax=Trichinella pseudospiralis TaxID=6337 RepID=A0A0V1FI60_TRIPS|nr:Rab GTPase-activating protein 1 [Trichinella pseudospiralis]
MILSLSFFNSKALIGLDYVYCVKILLIVTNTKNSATTLSIRHTVKVNAGCVFCDLNCLVFEAVLNGLSWYAVPASNFNEQNHQEFKETLTYYGCSNIVEPKNEFLIREIVRLLGAKDDLHAQVVTVRMPSTCQQSVQFFDNDGNLVDDFPVCRILFCTKMSEQKRCFLAFTFRSPTSVADESADQCHVLCAPDRATIERVMGEFARIFDNANNGASPHLNTFVAGNCSGLLSFELEGHLNIMERDDKGQLVPSPQEKTCFKLRRGREKHISLLINQVSGPYRLVVKKCFGLLLAAGRNVKHVDMQLLDVQSMRTKENGGYLISAVWDPLSPHFDVLNTETPREPLRFVVDCRVRIFDENERFWSWKHRDVCERYYLKVRLCPNGNEAVALDPNDICFESFSQRQRLLSPTVRRCSKGMLSNLIAPHDENESDSDEPLLSGSGEVKQEYSAAVLAEWNQCLTLWKDDLNQRPDQLTQLICNGIPDPLRGEVWQLLAGCFQQPELSETYPQLLTKECPNEQVIVRDIHRTFPAHDYFKQVGGLGQDALYKISKAYAVYDEEVGYCQGLSFLAASLLLDMSEAEAFCVLVRIMYHYRLRDLFKQGFETLHLRFYQLTRLMQVRLLNVAEKDYLPDLSEHFQEIHIETHMFASQWFLTLFTAKFPLSMVFHIIDLFLLEGMNTIFHIALALLKSSKKELLSLDFEGALKYFRVALPRKYRTEATAKELVQSAVKLRVSVDKVIEYEEDFLELKRQEAEMENPLEHYQKENMKLLAEVMRLERENEDLATKLVTSKVNLRKNLDAAEENIESLQVQLEKMARLCKDLQEDNRNQQEERKRMQEMCHREFARLEEENRRAQNIIYDYKQICSDLSKRLERLQKIHTDVTRQYSDVTSDCDNCSPRLESCRQQAEAELEEAIGGQNFDSSQLTASDDQTDQVNLLQLELAHTKLELVQCQCRNQELLHQLNRCSACQEQHKSTWLSKTLNSIKEAAWSPSAVVQRKDKEHSRSNTKHWLKFYVLVVLFASCGWITVNSVWVELPFLVNTLPEGWALPSFLALLVQVAILGPALFSLTKRYFSHFSFIQKPTKIIVASIAVDALTSLLISFLWKETSVVSGVPRSVALLSLFFIHALVDCTSNVLYLPYMYYFHQSFTNMYFVGLGLSGLIPSILSLSQGSGNVNCIFNSSTNTTEAVPVEARFSVALFFLMICLWVCIGLCAFLLLHILPDSTEIQNTNDRTSKTSGGVESDSALLSSQDAHLSRSQCMILLAFTTVVCCLINGVMPTVQSYASLPYGQTVFQMVIVLSSLANPICSYLSFVVPVTSLRIMALLTSVVVIACSYILYLASQSPFGVLKETFVGSFLCVGSFVIAAGLCSFLRTVIANRLRKSEVESRLLWCVRIVHRCGGDVSVDQRAIMERSLVRLLKQYVKRFEECGFLVKSSKNSRSLGPLGSLLRQNLLAQRHSIQTRNTYDCHVISPMVKSSTGEIFEMVLRTGELLQSQFSVQRPYSVVVETVNVGSQDAKPLLNSLFGTSSCLHCHVYHLPAADTVGLAFDKWNRRRLAFWKEISNWSSDFETTLSVDKRCATIGYCLKLPNDHTLVNKDAPIPVETVSWLEENNTAYIRCSMSVEAALATLIMNGLTVVDVNDQESNVMVNLHAALAPYKIVLLNCAHRRLTLESDADDEASLAVKKLWQFYRSFGTIRAVVVNAKTAQTGLVQLWHRSYNIVEEMPISHVKPKLAKEMLHTKAVDMEDFIE